MNRRSALTFALVLVAGAVAPLYAQERRRRGRTRRDRQVVDHHRGLRAGFRRRPRRARPGPRRQRRPPKRSPATPAPPATSAGAILGLVLIESLVIYVLLISLILFFLHRSAASGLGRRHGGPAAGASPGGGSHGDRLDRLPSSRPFGNPAAVRVSSPLVIDLLLLLMSVFWGTNYSSSRAHSRDRPAGVQRVADDCRVAQSSSRWSSACGSRDWGRQARRPTGQWPASSIRRDR